MIRIYLSLEYNYDDGVTSIVVVLIAIAKAAMIDNVLIFTSIVESDSGYAIYEVRLSLV